MYSTMKPIWIILISYIITDMAVVCVFVVTFRWISLAIMTISVIPTAMSPQVPIIAPIWSTCLLSKQLFPLCTDSL